jgi:hypothetical protein
VSAGHRVTAVIVWAFTREGTNSRAVCFNRRQEATAMAGEKREVARRWAATITGLFVILLLLYVLSVGPVARWVSMRQQSTEGVSREQIESLESFYSPLILMYRHCPPIMNAMNWYVNLWE